MSDDKIFAEGFSFKRNENAPSFVVGRVSVKVDDAIAWLKSNTKNGWVNLDVKQAKTGNYYMELDTWQPKPNGNQQSSSPKPETAMADEGTSDDLPF